MTTAANLAALGNGPAFSAYITTTGNLAFNSATKIPFGTESFDTNSNYDTTNYRFTPTVAGYYQINLSIVFSVNASRAYYLLLQLFKNGATISNRGLSVSSVGGGGEEAISLSAVVYMNGTTDYLEGYMYEYDYTASSTVGYTGGERWANFSGALVRAA